MTTGDQSKGAKNGVDPSSTAALPQEARASGASADGTGAGRENGIDFILDIPLEISVVLGQTRMIVSDLLKLGQGSIIELTKLAGETLEVLANQKLIARGEVVAVDEKYGIRITEIVSPAERIQKLG